jgi:hypothetical protein
VPELVKFSGFNLLPIKLGSMLALEINQVWDGDELLDEGLKPTPGGLLFWCELDRF